MPEGELMDAKTTLELFKEIGRLQATNEQILRKIEAMEQTAMPRQEILSRLREVRATTILAILGILMDALLTWHWVASK